MLEIQLELGLELRLSSGSYLGSGLGYVSTWHTCCRIIVREPRICQLDMIELMKQQV